MLMIRIIIMLRDHCHITEKYYRDSMESDYNINLKLKYKIPVVFHNVKNYDSHLIMQELGKFNLNAINTGFFEGSFFYKRMRGGMVGALWVQFNTPFIFQEELI